MNITKRIRTGNGHAGIIANGFEMLFDNATEYTNDAGHLDCKSLTTMTITNEDKVIPKGATYIGHFVVLTSAEVYLRGDEDNAVEVARHKFAAGPYNVFRTKGHIFFLTWKA